MSPTRLLLGQIFIIFAIVLLGVWAATQWCAAALGYQPQLGPASFMLFDIPVYEPWALFGWWYHYEAYAPEVFDTAGAIAAASGFLGCASAIAGSLWRARQSSHVTTYGSARWASDGEIRRAGLTRDAGVFLGQYGSRYLRHDGPEHVMAFAPTRSGKGVGLVVPTLLSWTGSAVVHDIKGENWQLTAGWRSRFSHALLFNPTDVASARYNPLLEVRRGTHEVRDAQNIADILVDPEGALERRNHWEKTSHSLLVGAILHILYAEEEKTLARVATFLSDPQRPFTATLKRMMSTNHLGSVDEPKVHPVVASAARELLNKSENERSGVLSTAMSLLGLYRDPTVAEVTSRCDWRIADLVEAPHPVSLYLVIPPSDISRTKPLVRLILNQIGRRLTEKLDDHRSSVRRHQLLMMLDEFPALGRLDFFETSLAFMAGYGVRAFLIAQSLNQIEKAYGEHHSILDNCHVRVAFATISGIGATVIAGAAWLALRPVSLGSVGVDDDREAVAAKQPSDALAGAPSSYGDVPKLGAPLPGDLGRPILERQRDLEMIRADPAADAAARAAQEAEAERQRVAAERRAARESGVMLQMARGVPTAPALAMPAAPVPLSEPPVPVQGADPNGQIRKNELVGRSHAGDHVNPHRLEAPASPWTLQAGSVIAGSLITGLNSDLPGIVTAQVTENAYDSVTGRTLLIPQGSRLIGSYDSVVAFGQSRALVVWQRLILPDGASIRIDNAPASDTEGYAGLSDRIDRHTWQLLKGVALSTLLGVGTELGWGSEESDLVRAIRESAQQSGSRAGDRIVARNLDVQPTLKVRPGWPLRIVVHKDLVLAPRRSR